jgi:IS1 family transposase
MRLVAASTIRPSAQKRKAVMNVLKPERQLAVIATLVEGNSVRSTERLTGVHRDTILRLVVRVGENCQRVMAERMRGVRCDKLQVDEVWTFCRKKQARLSYDERNVPDLGDQYVFIAVDADTKLVPHFDVGKRNMATAYRFIDTLKARLVEARFQLTTDGFVPYIGAVERAWGADSPDFGQLVKSFGALPPGPARYAPAKIIDAVPTVIYGNPDPAFISTSYVERQNLTVRMACRRFTRLTNAFSKKLDNLKAALALHFAWYNFVRIHRTLRVTPAMAAGITDRIWDLEELIA